MNTTPPVSEEPLFARHLIQRVCDRAAGRLDAECTHNAPRDTYFIGSLRPAPPPGTLPTTRLPQELLSKIAPTTFGLDAGVRPSGDGVDIDVELQWACYYRLLPTLKQQRSYQGLDGTPPSPGSSPPAGAPSPTRQRRERGGLFPRFRRLPCSASGTIQLKRTSGAEQWSAACTTLQAAIQTELDRARTVVNADAERLRWGAADEGSVAQPDLASEATYDAFVKGLPECPAAPWALEAVAVVRPGDAANDLVLDFQVTNRSWSPAPDGREDWRFECYVFEIETALSCSSGSWIPFELDLVPKGFRYDRTMWGRGFNCGVELATDTIGRPALRTTNVPRHEQLRYVTNDQPAAPFSDLASDPVPVLHAVLAAMESYQRDWEQQESAYRKDITDWDTQHASDFAQDKRAFVDEIARFRRGLLLLESNDDLLLAFQLTNRAFMGDPQKPAWRLFQLVFLVSQIPGIAALSSGDPDDVADRDIVDIIYFPTGGGKTEAYLGTIVFHLFFDRLRGKTAGVSVWTRFPLRLLTLQQTQRAADVVGRAELIRRSQPDARLSGPGIDQFAVGYFAGQEATPNELVPPRPQAPPEPRWSMALDPTERQRWKKVVRCPSCRTSSVTVDFDEQQNHLIHRCTSPGCAFQDGHLPVYVIDNEIYRYLPSVVVGTIDKLAGLGNQRKLSLFLGQVTGRCTKHGYYSHICCQKDCRDPQLLQPGIPRGVSGPTLFIQDELHLLKEGLGTFDAHYETFLQQLLHDFGAPMSLKVIASSATIEAFERQTAHLYGRRARVLPGPGPTLASSFYASTRAYPQRIFVGVLPHNKTIHNAALELVELFHRELHDLQLLDGASPYGGNVVPGSAEWTALIDQYSTSLSYFSSMRDLNSLRTDLDADTTPRLEADGYPSLRIAELTGSTTTDTVTSVLEQLEGRFDATPPPPNCVIATNMISHGVDVDRFNYMMFFGMPRQNAEYIQASSRAGRAHCGIVLACLKPARERDQSHFSYFGKYHEFLGRLVEPVAINRWSKFSLQRTIPGLYMAVLLQEIANAPGGGNPNKYYMLDFVKKKIASGDIRADQFIDVLERAYLVKDKTDDRSVGVKDEIRRRVGQFHDLIAGSGAGQDFVSDALIPKPMRSLREVDEQILIELDNNGSAWGSHNQS